MNPAVQAKWWRLFEARFGPPGERPESYWAPVIGHVCHVGVSEIGELTPGQLMACFDAVKSYSGKD